MRASEIILDSHPESYSGSFLSSSILRFTPPRLSSFSFRVKRLFSFDTAAARKPAAAADAHASQLAVLRVTSPCADGRGAAAFSGASGAARTCPAPDEEAKEGHWPNELVRWPAGRSG